MLNISCFWCKKNAPFLHPKNDHETHPSLHQHSSHCSKLTLFHHNPYLPINFRSSKKNVPPQIQPVAQPPRPSQKLRTPSFPPSSPSQPTHFPQKKRIAENLLRIWDFRAQRGHHNQHYVIPTFPVPTEPSCKASLSSVRPTAGGKTSPEKFPGEKNNT